MLGTFKFSNLRGDFYGGLTAAIVALPLALAFGVSSGAGPIAGLYGSIFVGFLAALFGGTPTQISGPTGPMTVVIAAVIATTKVDNPEQGLAIAFTVVVLGGLFQIIFGLLRLGKYITLIPYTVISGFMSGVGVIIICLQIGPLFGHPSLSGVVESIASWPTVLTNPHPIASFLGLLTLAIVFLMPRRLNRILPSPLLALIVGTVLSVYVFPNADIARIDDIPTGLPTLHMPVLPLSQLKSVLGYGLMLGTLGAIDSLLTSLVADNITRTQHDSNRELIGQGIGNCVSGLFGGLPGAGATMRTVINVQAGGQTSLSGIIHALVLAVILLQAGPLTAQIPHAVLAGILLKVGIDIIDWGFLKRAHRISTKATFVMYGVLLLTVFVDLITAVGAGVFVANILTIERQAEWQASQVKALTTADDSVPMTDEERELLNRANGRVLLFSLGGPMSFGAAKTISRRMAILGNYDVLILDLTDVPLIGVTASLAIETMVKEARSRARDIFVVGANPGVMERLSRLGVIDIVPVHHRLSSRLHALQKAHTIVEQLRPARVPNKT